MLPSRPKGGRKCPLVVTPPSWPWKLPETSRRWTRFTTDSAAVGAGAGSAVLARRLPRPRHTELALSWSISSTPAARSWSGADPPATRYPITPARTSRNSTKVWIRCSSTFLPKVARTDFSGWQGSRMVQLYPISRHRLSLLSLRYCFGHGSFSRVLPVRDTVNRCAVDTQDSCSLHLIAPHLLQDPYHVPSLDFSEGQ